MHDLIGLLLRSPTGPRCGRGQHRHVRRAGEQVYRRPAAARCHPRDRGGGARFGRAHLSRSHPEGEVGPGSQVLVGGGPARRGGCASTRSLANWFGGRTTKAGQSNACRRIRVASTCSTFPMTAVRRVSPPRTGMIRRQAGLRTAAWSRSTPRDGTTESHYDLAIMDVADRAPFAPHARSRLGRRTGVESGRQPDRVHRRYWDGRAHSVVRHRHGRRARALLQRQQAGADRTRAWYDVNHLLSGSGPAASSVPGPIRSDERRSRHAGHTRAKRCRDPLGRWSLGDVSVPARRGTRRRLSSCSRSMIRTASSSWT